MTKYKEVDDHFIDHYRSLFNFIIITATVKERQHLHKYIQPLPGHEEILKVQRAKHTYYIGTFGAYYCVHVGSNEMGSVGRNASLVTTIDAISTWSPSVILMVGIAFGAKDDEQQIGDVLVSEYIIPYDPKKVKPEEVIPRGNSAAASSTLIDRYKAVTDWGYMIEERQPLVLPGKILSGETLLNNIGLKKELLERFPEVIGGEMEGIGVASACDERGVSWILVKGICDYADGNKDENKDQYQDMAADSAINLSEHIFNAKFGFKDLGLVPQTEVVKTDFSEEHGAIPKWMHQRERFLAKDLRDEN